MGQCRRCIARPEYVGRSHAVRSRLVPSPIAVRAVVAIADVREPDMLLLRIRLSPGCGRWDRPPGGRRSAHVLASQPPGPGLNRRERRSHAYI
jgi:hypothetical protein